MTGTYIHMAAALAFVILLILAGGFFLKKRQNRFGLMSIVGYQSFGPKKGVAALKIGKEILILGVTQNEMRLLRVFKDGELELSETGDFHGKLKTFRSSRHFGIDSR